MKTQKYSNNLLALVTRNKANYGKRFTRNFQNSYLPDEALKKPSRKVAAAIAKFTQDKIDQKLMSKTRYAFVSGGGCSVSWCVVEQQLPRGEEGDVVC